jgi:hypothetical protein
MRLFDARVYHLNQDIWVFIEINHQFLSLLHLAEAVLINEVSIVEE